MKKSKVILLFTDLEGTILREEDGQYSDKDMNQFLSQIDILQSLTGAKVHLHLVSPVYPDQMETIMDEIDRSISAYNRAHMESDEILQVESGAAYPETAMTSQEFLGDRVVYLRKPLNEKDFDTAQYGKEHYVKLWYQMYEEHEMKDLIMAIYCGNGRNDLRAMDYINGQGKGFVVCPQNSRREAKSKAFHISDKCDLKGITEGIERINKEIEKRKPNQENPAPKFKRAQGGIEL